MNRSRNNINEFKYLYYLNFLKFSKKKVNNDIIKDTTNTCCNYSFEKPNNLKEIFNSWDVFINWSINSGNSHISFTINLDKNNQTRINSFTSILKSHPITLNSDKHKSYIKLRNLLFSDNNELYFYISEISTYNKLITWEYISTEENKNEVLHIHGIIAYRNLIDFNKNIIINISNKLKEEFSKSDIIFKNLNNFKDIKNWIKYLHIKKILVFSPRISIIPKHLEMVYNLFNNPYKTNYKLKNNSNLEENYKIDPNFNIEFHPLDIFFEQPEQNLNLSGIILKKNELNENILIDLILNYFILNKMFIYNDNIYTKIENTLISYKKIGTIKEIVFENFENNLILFFNQNYPCQSIGLDFYYLLKTFKNKMENNILKIKNLTTNKINLNFSFLEFNDGVYDIQNNKFWEKNSFNMINISTTKYYNKSYDWIRHNKPTEWIKGLRNALGNNNLEDFTLICLFIASFFQKRDENLKKNFLYVHGKTNTGKSTYLTKVLTRYFGAENIGNIVNSSNFKFQDLHEKILVIMDEFKYTPSFSSDFLKILGGESLLIPQKYSKNHITIEKLMGIILSNYLITEKNENTYKALLERFHIVEFLYSIDKNNTNINKKLSDEEPNIIIFCNKLYFSYFNKKTPRNNKNKVTKQQNTKKYLKFNN